MAFLTDLDVINDMLATLGESPLNAIDEDHPMVAAGLRMLRVASNREQAKGWWFNREVVTLSPDPTTQNIMVPADAISVDPVTPSNHFVQRGRRLYNPATSNFKFTSKVECKIIRLVPFEDLPVAAAAFIGLSAVLRFTSSYDADETKVKDIKADLRDALATLNAEHIRNVNVNMLTRPSMAIALGRLGMTPQLGPITY